MTETLAVYLPSVSVGAQSQPETRTYHGCASAVSPAGEQCFVSVVVDAPNDEIAAAIITTRALWLWPEVAGWRWHAGDAQAVGSAKTD